jgi:hypothetical protein
MMCEMQVHLSIRSIDSRSALYTTRLLVINKQERVEHAANISRYLHAHTCIYDAIAPVTGFYSRKTELRREYWRREGNQKRVVQ